MPVSILCVSKCMCAFISVNISKYLLVSVYVSKYVLYSLWVCAIKCVYCQ